MNILLVNWQDRANPHAGGAEIHLFEIFSRLAAAGHRVRLVWRFQLGDLRFGKANRQRGHGIVQMVRLARAHDWRGDIRLVHQPG